MNTDNLRARLRARSPVFGTMLFVCRNPRWAHILGNLGMDFAIIDAEEAPIDHRELAGLVGMLDHHDVVPLVRLAEPSALQAQIALAAGAAGFIAPSCETVEQVRAVVAVARWSPLRGEALARAQVEGAAEPARLKQAQAEKNRRHVALIGIESARALEEIDRLLAIEGIDGVFVDLRDLAASLGFDRASAPALEPTLQRVRAACAARGVAFALWPLRRAQMAHWLRAGMTLAVVRSDVRALDAGFRDDLEALRAAVTDIDPGSSEHSS